MLKSQTQLRDDWLADVARNKHVCINHAVRWAKCAEGHYKAADPPIRVACARHRDELNSCVSDWRATADGAGVSVKGDFPGAPPPQCQRLNCLIQTCLKEQRYNQHQCKDVTAAFKHCTKLFYGSEFVD